MIFDWPANLIPQDIAVIPPHKTAGLNTGLDGFTQSVPAIRPPFHLELEFGNLFDDEVLSWRAADALFEGRTNIVRIPLFDLWHRASDAQIYAGTASHSDGTNFSDGTGYATPDLIGVTVSGVQGQRRLKVDFGGYGELLQAGLYFGLGEHPYIARRVWWEGSVATIEASPTLRKAYTNEPLKLKPTMLAGLKQDDAVGILLRQGRYGPASLSLVERFDEPLS